MPVLLSPRQLAECFVAHGIHGAVEESALEETVRQKRASKTIYQDIRRSADSQMLDYFPLEPLGMGKKLVSNVWRFLECQQKLE